MAFNGIKQKTTKDKTRRKNKTQTVVFSFHIYTILDSVTELTQGCSFASVFTFIFFFFIWEPSFNWGLFCKLFMWNGIYISVQCGEWAFYVSRATWFQFTELYSLIRMIWLFFFASIRNTLFFCLLLLLLVHFARFLKWLAFFLSFFFRFRLNYKFSFKSETCDINRFCAEVVNSIETVLGFIAVNRALCHYSPLNQRKHNFYK